MKLHKNALVVLGLLTAFSGATSYAQDDIELNSRRCPLVHL